MKYALLIYSSDDEWDSLSEDEQSAIYGEYCAISETPGVIGGAELAAGETATTVRVADGETLTTDGPFAETKEVLGGYYLFEADDLDDAIELAARIPAARTAARSRCGRWWSADGADEAVFRDEWGRVLAILIGFLGDFDLAEEAAQEAFAVAAERWPRDGAAGQPGRLARRRRRATARSTASAASARSPRRRDAAGVAREPFEDEMDDETSVPRRAARADLHVLPPGARARRPGRADAAHARRPDDGRDRARVPRARADDGAAARPREAEDPRRRHPLPRAARPPAARPAGRGARRRLPDLQRGLRRPPARPRAPRRSGSAAALAELMPDEPEAHGLLALMLLHDARREARFARRRARAARRPGPRAAGTTSEIAEGRARSTARSRCGGRGPYALQAAIAVAARERAARLARRSPRSTASSRGSPARRSSS